MVARLTYVPSVQSNLACSRRRCWRGAGDNVGARWHCLRSRVGLARHLRALRYHRTVACLCIVRSESDFGARARLIAGCCHSWRGFSAIWRRSRSRRGAGRHDGGCFWDCVHSCGHCAARLRHRTFIQTHPVWIHERNRADRADQPIAQIFRLLGRGRGPLARIMGHWQSGCGWKVKLGGVCDRRRHAGGSSASQEKHTLSGNTCCCSWRDGNRRFVGP